MARQFEVVPVNRSCARQLEVVAVSSCRSCHRMIMGLFLGWGKWDGGAKALRSSLALARTLDATLQDLLLHLHTRLMLRFKLERN